MVDDVIEDSQALVDAAMDMDAVIDRILDGSEADADMIEYEFCPIGEDDVP